MIKNDKTKLKNWLAGDVFAYKINSNKYPDYNGRYLIFIKCDIKKEDWVTNSRTTKYFRIKITAKKEIPTSCDEIENLEYKYNDYLSILTSGPIPPNPSEMLGSNQLTLFINKLKEMYDLIILDSAPLQAVTDAQLLSVKADGTIIVVEAEKTKKDDIVSAKELLQKVDANILGLVLNKSKNREKKYYYYYGERGERKKKRKVIDNR